MRVALDVESVLADPNEPVLRTTDQLTRRQINETWFTNQEESDAYQVYMGVSDAIWRHKPEIIPPEEPDISQYVNDIYDEAGILDIVTHRQHVDKEVMWWLKDHGIKYDGFVSCDVPKHELGYDVYIDDNPNLFGDCRLLLVDQPWNEFLPDEDSKMCDRVYSLYGATEFL